MLVICQADPILQFSDEGRKGPGSSSQQQPYSLLLYLLTAFKHLFIVSLSLFFFTKRKIKNHLPRDDWKRWHVVVARVEVFGYLSWVYMPA